MKLISRERSCPRIFRLEWIRGAIARFPQPDARNHSTFGQGEIIDNFLLLWGLVLIHLRQFHLSPIALGSDGDRLLGQPNPLLVNAPSRFKVDWMAR